ncbi:hypothetical protein NMY22_g11256 [Coprinellus aureogranulatus]|nr:hypothetical protein NMY22_g11256 [Coprinellus aureogranulatus]
MDRGDTPLGLPLELFLEICRTAVTGDDAVSPLLLGEVCHSWRDACYSAPSLWTLPKVTLPKADTPSPLIGFGNWVEGARNLPLTLHIFDPSRFLPPERRSFIFELLAKKSSQIESLTLEAPSLSMSSHSDGLPSSDRYRWHILSHLALSCTGDPASQVFHTCPRLTHLRFEKSEYLPDGIRTQSWIPWERLVTVDLPGLASDDLMRVFRWAPNFQSLITTEVMDDVADPGASDIWEVDDYVDNEDTPPLRLIITHQRLKNWYFTQIDNEYLFDVFNNMRLLRLPALKSLRIEWGSTWEDGYTNRLAHAMKDWGCELEELDLWLGGFPENSLAGWIGESPEAFRSLRSLKMHWEYHSQLFSSDLFEAMSATQDYTPVLPTLESLVVQDTPLEFSPDVMIKMLSSRWDSGGQYPLKSCVINVRLLEGSRWRVTGEHETTLEMWRKRGFKVEFGVSRPAEKKIHPWEDDVGDMSGTESECED